MREIEKGRERHTDRLVNRQQTDSLEKKQAFKTTNFEPFPHFPTYFSNTLTQTHTHTDKSTNRNADRSEGQNVSGLVR